MNPRSRTTTTLTCLAIAFVTLLAIFLTDGLGRPSDRFSIPLVDEKFLDTATIRQSYADLVEAEEDVFHFECYICHEEGKPLTLKFDEEHHVIIPDEHSNIVMGHGRHNRNNDCFNCHDETNLEQFQTRDGRALKFNESTQLCGSCHGPTLRDWEAGAHGRINGYWDQTRGPARRQDCVNCHDPHSPRFPSRTPAPGPHPLHLEGESPASQAPTHGNE